MQNIEADTKGWQLGAQPGTEPKPTEGQLAGKAKAHPADIQHLIVVGHPAPDSFCHSIARAYADAVVECGQRCVTRDLYAIGFDPLLKADERPEAPDFHLSPDVEAELSFVKSSRSITLVYPIWFGMPPAIIKGYVDRVLGAGLGVTAVHDGKQQEVLSGKQLVLLTTSGTSLPWLAEKGLWYSLREAFDYYLEAIFSFASCEHEHFDSIISPLPAERVAECLARTEDRARTICSVLLNIAHREQMANLRGK